MPLQQLRDLPAPAKLNLFLHINGRRPDGYHLLQSVFVLIDWADTLHLTLRRDGQLIRRDLGPALPADDLSLRAARALQQASGSPLGVDIEVLKQVPWGAGMGGGSSDAATVLLGLNKLWGLHWPRARLLALAVTLGADVPFFVGGHNAWVEGIGEQLSPVRIAPQWFAVLKPAPGVATASIFSSQHLQRSTERAIVASFLGHESVCSNVGNDSSCNSGERSDAGFGRNDLQPVAEALCPDIALAARLLAQRFGNSRMTGSGSAVFARIGMFTGDQPVPAWPAGNLPEGWVGKMCRSLPHHPLQGWAA